MTSTEFYYYGGYYVGVLFHSVTQVQKKKKLKRFPCCQYIKEDIECTLKTPSKKFEIRVPFNCESKKFNLCWLPGRISGANTSNT